MTSLLPLAEIKKKALQALETGDTQAAVAYLNHWVDRDPQDTEGWLWLAATQQGENRTRLLGHVLTLDPTNAQALKTLELNGNLPEEAIALAEDNPPEGDLTMDLPELKTPPLPDETIQVTASPVPASNPPPTIPTPPATTPNPTPSPAINNLDITDQHAVASGLDPQPKVLKQPGSLKPKRRFSFRIPRFLIVFTIVMVIIFALQSGIWKIVIPVPSTTAPVAGPFMPTKIPNFPKPSPTPVRMATPEK